MQGEKSYCSVLKPWDMGIYNSLYIAVEKLSSKANILGGTSNFLYSCINQALAQLTDNCLIAFINNFYTKYQQLLYSLSNQAFRLSLLSLIIIPFNYLECKFSIFYISQKTPSLRNYANLTKFFLTNLWIDW
jgi:hypothetical protein